MDYKYLVESEKYNIKDLRPGDREFINGMKYATELLDEAADFVKDELMTGMSTLDSMTKEIAQTAIEGVQEYLYTSACELIVGYIDNYADADDAPGTNEFPDDDITAMLCKLSTKGLALDKNGELAVQMVVKVSDLEKALKATQSGEQL